MQLHEDNPRSIRAMLEYLYTDDYKPVLPGAQTTQLRPWPENPTQTDGVLALEHAHVFIAADKYNVPGLKGLAATRFEKSIQSISHGCTENHIDALSLVLEKTASDNNPLYNSVLEILRKNLQLLFQRPKFEALMLRHPDLMSNLLKRFSSGWR